MSQHDAPTAGRPDDAGNEPWIDEPRWPPAVALVGFMALNIGLRLWLPNQGCVRVPWLFPAIEAVLLVVLLTSDPGSSPSSGAGCTRSRSMLVGVLVAAALWATVLLVYDLIKGLGVTNSPGRAPRLGRRGLARQQPRVRAAVLADRRRRADRALPAAVPVDFAFTQQLSPELAPPGWRPVFLDYLHLGFTNATAFSPTDVMPLTHRAKYTMLVQSTVALALFGLIVARAVNAFT